MTHVYDYLIVGGGLAGASAVEGIRELDAAGRILLVGEESHLSYDRPPLSKQLWFGKKKWRTSSSMIVRSTTSMPLPWRWAQEWRGLIPLQRL